MEITYDMLKDLLRCNKHIKIELVENTSTLNILNYNKVILNINIEGNNIESNSQTIYDAITNLDGINLYIPKIYVPNK